ncbi:MULTISPECIES: MFS transporter [unclassified Haladaptatus]|uniref:MFS transporter n=1 Tax=unclassified Haladaptatus TaxID=2622732 RepID=UPI00209BE3FE|nr:MULTISPECIES: MFS transporter [unclassified Haladaptatus]MCO8244531.1 MFS transporter [Haladaptatus sp. AB643]MCO8253847.1 MFS transporter [Haladaptatus sp. AB618]
MGLPSDISETPRRARIADSIVFGVLGIVFATWAVRIPAVRSKIGASSGDIGLALLGLACGSIVGLVAGGWLVSHHGGRRIIRIGLPVYCLSLLSITLANRLDVLVTTLVVFGVGKGLTDVAANAQGMRIEHGYSGQIMGSFHALFSGGGLVGAGIGAVATTLGLSVRTHFLIVGLALLAGGLAASAWLLPKNGDSGAEPSFSLPSRKLAGFCAIGFCALFIEGVGNDWSAVFLKSSVGTTATVAALGFGAFSLTMMLGRFLSDYIVVRLGSQRFIRTTAIVAALGLALTLVAQTIVSLVGLALLGFGLAGLMPVAMSMAGNYDPEAPAEPAIAAVSTTGYGGFAIGPVIIGVIADATTLRTALVPALILALLVAVFTGILPTVSHLSHERETST